jgi:hypothetical protein
MRRLKSPRAVHSRRADPSVPRKCFRNQDDSCSTIPTTCVHTYSRFHGPRFRSIATLHGAHAVRSQSNEAAVSRPAHPRGWVHSAPRCPLEPPTHPGVLYAYGSPRRRRSRSQARTAWRCELAWPGQAAHPAGSYKYSHLSQRFSVRASYDDINFGAVVHLVTVDYKLRCRHQHPTSRGK